MHGLNSDNHTDRLLRRTAVWLLVMTLLFILHASFYPFEFSVGRLRALGMDDLRHAFAWRRVPRSDVIANLLFYLPLGALVTYLTPRRWPYFRRWLGAAICGASLSFTLECLQILTRDRDPSVVDVLANTLSAALAAAGVLGIRGLGVRPTLPALRAHRPDPVSVLLIGAWLTFHAAPFMPTVRFMRYLREPALLLRYDATLAGSAGYLAGYLILAGALRAVLRLSSFWPAFALLAVGSLVARVVFRGHHFELDEALGLALALPIVVYFAREGGQAQYLRAGLVASLCIAVFALLPFDASAYVARFAWADGLTLLARSPAGEPGLVELAFLNVGAVWMLAEAGLPLRRLAPAAIVAATFIEAGQAWEIGKSAHLVAPVLVIFGLLVVQLGRGPTASAAADSGSQ